jgi:hypothetical protein
MAVESNGSLKGKSHINGYANGHTNGHANGNAKGGAVVRRNQKKAPSFLGWAFSTFARLVFNHCSATSAGLTRRIGFPSGLPF